MKILFDHQIFTIQEYGGISNYFSKLFDNFNGDKNMVTRIALKYSNNVYLKENNNVLTQSFFPTKQFRGRYRIQNVLNKRISIKKLKKGDFDIFHSTYYDPYFLKYLNGKPFVLTVFDMIHEKYIKNPKDKVIEWKKLLVEKADKIIAISQNTKNDIIEILGVNEKKIKVISLAGNTKIVDIIKPDFEIPEKYLLYIGLRNGYKNFNFFLESIASILSNDSTLSLLCIGGGKLNKTEKNLIKSLKITGKVKQYSIENKYLSYIYKNAQAFVLPSLYEGFGIPILEAYSNDCAAVLSEHGSMPEVGGDCAVYFNPQNKNSIKESVLKVLNSEQLKKELVAKGKKRVKSFSWELCSTETLDVYKSVLNINF